MLYHTPRHWQQNFKQLNIAKTNSSSLSNKKSTFAASKTYKYAKSIAVSFN